MELAHPPSITFCQIKSQTSDPSKHRSTYLTPWPQLKPTRRCPVQIMDAMLCRPHPTLMGRNVQRKTPSRNIGPSVPYASDSSGAEAGTGEGEGRDKPATEAFLKLYTAIKERNAQVLAFLSFLMTAMGKHVEIVIQPTPSGGMNVGIQWTLGHDFASAPFGKGCSFYSDHWYKGKLLLRNADTFIDPIVHGMKPILLKWAAFLVPIVERVSPIIKHKRVKAFIYCLLTLVTVCTLLTILKRSPL